MSNKKYIYIIVFSIMLMSCLFGLVDYDYFWQTDLGRNIIQNGNFNAIYDQIWGTLCVDEYLDHEWLTNIIFYLLSGFGYYSIFITKLLIVLFLSFCICKYIKFENKDFNTVTFVLFIVFLLINSIVFTKVKAYSISVGFVILEVLYLKSYSKYKYNRYFIYELIICLLWNNMHSGSLPLFFVIAGVYWLVNLRKDWKSLLCGIGCALTTLINPWGYKLLLFNFSHNNDSVMKEYLLDWKAIDGKTPEGIFGIILVFITVFLFIKLDIKKHMFDLIMIFLVMFLSFQSERHLIYLLPFTITLLLNSEFNIRENINNIIKISCIIASCLAIIVLVKIPFINMKQDYACIFISDELENILKDTNKDSSDGLYAVEAPNILYGLKYFTSGGYPCTRNRFKDSYYITRCGNENDIEKIIDYYDLNKFLINNYNTDITYYSVYNSLYCYLENNIKYKCLYKDDYYSYFVEIH